jgi:hypothetical protein
MPTDAELTFADHAGRFYARRYGFPPMVGRLVGYLMLCDPRDQSIAELADALLASRSAIAGAIKHLETLQLIIRTRSAGDRMDRVQLNRDSPNAMGMDPSEYREVGDLAREGLEVLHDAPPARRAILLEMAAFADFLVEQMPLMAQAWQQRRAALVTDGTLLDLPEASRQ